ncbi:hypothetical protein PENSPDRAFT_63238 [Peniophora sp. CONT]|nr:hypothetical protein PENSPDRAFT_63238 [Peniophora sp. CONT]
MCTSFTNLPSCSSHGRHQSTRSYFSIHDPSYCHPLLPSSAAQVTTYVGTGPSGLRISVMPWLGPLVMGCLRSPLRSRALRPPSAQAESVRRNLDLLAAWSPGFWTRGLAGADMPLVGGWRSRGGCNFM